MRLALINDQRVAYEIGGDPDGYPVLIIHGTWGGPASTLWNGPRIRWQPSTDGLQLVWYDRRCAGLSQYSADPFTLDDLVNDAINLLDYLALPSAAVIATSAGGPIGLRLALDHPRRVEALALLNTGASLMSVEPQGVDLDDPLVIDRLGTVAKRHALLDLLATRGIDAAVATEEEEWRAPPDPQIPGPPLEPFQAHRRRALQRLPQDELNRLALGALLNMQAQRDIDLLDELANIRCPTLIIHGTADTTVPIAYGRALSAAMPGAELVELPDAGHGLITDLRSQQIITDWLRHSSSSSYSASSQSSSS